MLDSDPNPNAPLGAYCFVNTRFQDALSVSAVTRSVRLSVDMVPVSFDQLRLSAYFKWIAPSLIDTIPFPSESPP